MTSYGPGPTALFLRLMAGHALADFALQSEFMAKHKNRHNPSSYIPPGQTPQTIWPYVLCAHGAIHGLVVGFILWSMWLGVAEFLAHTIIDFGKCENWYGIHTDQWLHFACKALWVWIALSALNG